MCKSQIHRVPETRVTFWVLFRRCDFRLCLDIPEHREVISSEVINSCNNEGNCSSYSNTPDLAKCSLILLSASFWKTTSFLPIRLRGL